MPGRLRAVPRWETPGAEGGHGLDETGLRAMEQVETKSGTAELRGHLHLRLAESTKRRIEDAAISRGQTVTDFVKAAALDRAEVVLEQDRRLRLSDDGMRAFLEALDAPPEPNARLRRLLAE